MPETAKTTTARRTKATDSDKPAQGVAPAPSEAPRSVWERLAEPFPQEDLERLPKPLSRDDRNRGRCAELPDGRPNPYSADGYYCGGWHARSVHLTYVGHAGITTRLNQVLTPAGWDFGPLVSHPQSGLPFMERGEFWGRLTITDPETGVATSKTDLAANYNSTQEAWGDALRRCAMRFGVGTYLWSKSEAAHAQAQFSEPPPETSGEAPDETPVSGPASPEPGNERQPEPHAQPERPPHVQVLWDKIKGMGPEDTARLREWWQNEGLPQIDHLDEWQAAAVESYLVEMAGNAPDPSVAR